MMLTAAAGAGAQNQTNRFVLERNDKTIVLEPYADNIVRITLSTAKSAALGQIDRPYCSREPAATPRFAAG
jgi:hypothetical protein